jgi:zeta-carotene isomerase
MIVIKKTPPRIPINFDAILCMNLAASSYPYIIFCFFMYCRSAAHLAMVGSSFTALTMALLVGHHWFSCWNGDRRLEAEHGEDFLKVKERTSILPFQAIIEGRQVLPKDYYRELLRGPFFLIAAGSIGAYFAHPYMQAGSALVRNTGLAEGGILDKLF